MDWHQIGNLLPLIVGAVFGITILVVFLYASLVDIPNIEKQADVHIVQQHPYLERHYDEKYEAKKRERWDKRNRRRVWWRRFRGRA